MGYSVYCVTPEDKIKKRLLFIVILGPRAGVFPFIEASTICSHFSFFFLSIPAISSILSYL